MITLLLTALGTTITVWIRPINKLWKVLITKVSFLFVLSIFLYKGNKKVNWKHLSFALTVDKLSSPLIILRCWLIPVSIMARIKKISNKRASKQRSFLTFKIWILIALVITFSTTKLIVFFIAFEATLIPTLLLISRWGMRKERIEASYYFLFYTLIRSLPLLVGIIIIYLRNNQIKIILRKWKPQKIISPTLVLFCIIAFLVKVPIFTFHLWLPKAHVEAPVAGSMILAAILLKMGGYGFIRLFQYFWEPLTTNISPFVVLFCCWGGVLTRLICISQTDLKSLIAYSSVSHMRFMIAGISTGTEWGIKASIIVMVAHGLVSSALFALAKIFYERRGTRTLLVKRSLKTAVILLPLFWLIFVCAKLGLPPLPKAIGEIMGFSAIVKWRLISYFPIALGVVFTRVFSLLIYQFLNRGWKHKWKVMNRVVRERERLLMILHFLPLILILFRPNIIS